MFVDRSAAAAAGTSWSFGKMSGSGPAGVILCIDSYTSVVAVQDCVQHGKETIRRGLCVCGFSYNAF